MTKPHKKTFSDDTVSVNYIIFVFALISVITLQQNWERDPSPPLPVEEKQLDFKQWFLLKSFLFPGLTLDWKFTIQ